MSKKAKRWIIAGICFVVIIAGIVIPPMVLSRNIHNAFDEVYYSFDQKLWPRYTDCHIRNMPVLLQETNPQKYQVTYDEKYLDFTKGILISYSNSITSSYNNTERQQLFFELIIPLGDSDIPTSMIVQCLYLPNVKELIYRNIMVDMKVEYLPQPHPKYDEYSFSSISDPNFIAPILEQNNITREDIAGYQHYLLYEKFLPDWFAANGGPSKFSMENLGEFTVVDETYRQLGADWGLDE